MKIQMMNGKQFFVCLPYAICRAMQLKRGDDLKVRIGDRGELILKK